MPKNLINITAGLIVLSLITLLAVRRCGGRKISNDVPKIVVDKIMQDQAEAKRLYEDSLDFARGQAELQAAANAAKTLTIIALEKKIDILLNKHEVTKKKIKPFFDTSGARAMLVPPEYIEQCQECYSIIGTYKKENIQLRFERDAYDTLMRSQGDIQEKRIQELEGEKLVFNKMFNDCQSARTGDAKVTRKLKISAMGMANNLFVPRGIGPGLIYEDKKYNEFGGHVIFASAGNMYLIHAAKTISFRRKK